jgi:Fe-S cluster assembly iron-binding protein IscA
MIDVTERAKKELKELLANKVDHPAACLRLRTDDEGKLGLGIDIEKPDDEVVEYEGSSLLVVEPQLADALKGTAIDVVEGDEGRELVIVNKPE